MQETTATLKLNEIPNHKKYKCSLSISIWVNEVKYPKDIILMNDGRTDLRQALTELLRDKEVLFLHRLMHEEDMSGLVLPTVTGCLLRWHWLSGDKGYEIWIWYWARAWYFPICSSALLKMTPSISRRRTFLNRLSLLSAALKSSEKNPSLSVWGILI